MTTNRRYLISQLANTELDGRFSNIVPINCDSSGKKLGPEGALSVVFRSDDSVTGRPVAIKFFDPDFGGIQQIYRLAAFKRESEILESLIGRERCLQLLLPIQETRIPITTDSGENVEMTCAYCATEWLEEEIKQYFRMQERYEAVAKISVYRDAALAIFALHRNGIQHRDIKADNLMIASRELNNLVVAIDLGTAARATSGALGDVSIYSRPVGAPWYAPLEAHCGLSGVRSLSTHSDFYALGCLLYELFNIDYHHRQLLMKHGFQRCRALCDAHMGPHLAAGTNDEQLIHKWSNIIRQTKRLVTLPKIDDPGSSVPPSLHTLLNELLEGLTKPDYRERLCNGDSVIRKLDTALRVLKHEILAKEAVTHRRARRRARALAAERKRERLMKYLEQQRQDGD